MAQFMAPGELPTKYAAVAASATNTNLGPVGASGDFLHNLTVIPATATPGAVTLKDGTTAVLSIPAGTTIVPYTLEIDAASTTGAWNITTGASVSVFATGKFT